MNRSNILLFSHKLFHRLRGDSSPAGNHPSMMCHSVPFTLKFHLLAQRNYLVVPDISAGMELLSMITTFSNPPLAHTHTRDFPTKLTHSCVAPQRKWTTMSCSNHFSLCSMRNEEGAAEKLLLPSNSKLTINQQLQH